MRRIIRISGGTLLVVCALAMNACNRHAQAATENQSTQAKPSASISPAAAAEDARIASRALNIQDVLRLLKEGASQEAIVAQVRERHLTQKIVEAQELELSLMGARRQLLAELKNASNVLTESQELAYGRLHQRK